MTTAEILTGAIDTHVHSSPDVIPRKLDDLELVEQARAAGMAGLVLKCHHACTCGRAYLLNRFFPDIRVFGGIVLNAAAGGFNPRAVEAALKMGATQVWMPTKSAANHQRHLGGRGGLTIFDGARLRDDVALILRQVAEADAILATGHLSPEESRVLVDEALAAGVSRISVTHPEWGVTAMPVAVQQKLASSGSVFFERCLVSTRPDLQATVPFETLVGQIRAVGVATTIAATDYGLPQLPTPLEGLADYAERLLQSGFSAADVRRMVRDNPARLLGLD
ncbi:MAG TPA: DUF6282 family protein [Opitutaceae bacterium]|nr:DUF6282 family protein [Opitutaceae bacterium]